MSLRQMHEAQKQSRITQEKEQDIQLIQKLCDRVELLEQELQNADLRISEQNLTIEKQLELLEKLNEENKSVDSWKKSNAELRKKNSELSKRLNEEQKNRESDRNALERAEREVGTWKSKVQEWKNEAQEQEKKNRENQKAISRLQWAKNVAENKNKQNYALFKRIRLHLLTGVLIILFGFLMANKGITDDLEAILKLFKDAYELVEKQQGTWQIIQAVILALVLCGVIYGGYRFCRFYYANFWDDTSKKVTYYLTIVLISFAKYIPVNIFFLFLVVQVVYIGVRMYRTVEVGPHY